MDDINEEVDVEVKVSGLAAVTTAQPHGDTPTYDVVSVELKSVNGVAKNSKYTRLVLPAIVKFDTQTSDGAFTTYRLNVDDYDGAQIYNLKIYTAERGDTVVGKIDGLVTNGAEFDATNASNAQVVTKVEFNLNAEDGALISLTNDKFSDYFKTTDGKSIRTLQTKDN